LLVVVAVTVMAADVLTTAVCIVAAPPLPVMPRLAICCNVHVNELLSLIATVPDELLLVFIDVHATSTLPAGGVNDAVVAIVPAPWVARAGVDESTAIAIRLPRRCG
jgi:hypothetical protein